jgi:dihydroxy-acid dehydratase
MDPRNLEKQREPEEPRYLTFPHLPDDAKHEDGTPALNKYSSTLTTGHNFPGAQVRYSQHHEDRATSVANMDTIP